MFKSLFRRKETAEPSSADESDYLDYCKSIELTLRNLEATLHSSDNPEEVALMAMQTACNFYGADWCGFVEVDLDLGLWTPYLWYNTHLLS